MKIKLPQVTLLGIDCVNAERLKIALDISEEKFEFGAVKLLTSLPIQDPRLVKIPHLGSIEEFSYFCIKNLVDYVDTEYVLLVQYDGFILNPESWTPEFLEYDYIGAPLSWGQNKTDNENLKFTVGNGGFCLRSKKFLEASARFTQEGKITKFDPEDEALCVWYRDLFENEKFKYAPIDLAMKFSVVEDYGNYDKPFGFHGLFNKNMDELKKNHPNFPMHYFLPRIRVKRLESIKKRFEEIAIEGHLFETENKDTLNVWLTIKDEEFEKLAEKRLDYYAKPKDMVYTKEPSTKIGEGILTFAVYQTRVGLVQINYYLCPESASFTTSKSKKLFGDTTLPIASTEQEKILSQIQDFIKSTHEEYFLK